MLRLPHAGQQHRANHAEQQDEIPFAEQFDAFFAVGRRIARQKFAFFGEIAAVDDIENGEQDDGGNQHGGEHVLYRPHEVHAFQETQEQRRVAQRCEAAADVGHQKDKENHDVHVVFAVVVCFQQRANHQHGSSGGAHDGGEQGADGQKRGVELG